ncbi:ABC transporter permease [Brassicibacter mesophilus]|uniref:ABC transporter permease n=1 Tax=Brassicibacter mesophilus TaxID=745119 RepID=UPI003D1C1B23
MRLKDTKTINYILSFLIIVIVWEIFGLIANNNIFPPVHTILMNILKDFKSQIIVHALFSLKRIIIGILFSLIIGVPLGIAMGYFERIDRIFSPLMYFSYPIPKIALLPIVMLVLGLGESTKIVMILLITFFPVVVNIRDDVRNMSSEVYYPMTSLGASNLQIVKEIVLPGIIPTILTSIRIGIGTAISVLFFTENFGTEYGMGYFIMDSWMRVNYIQMYSGIIVLSLIGLSFFIIIDIVENLICKWK